MRALLPSGRRSRVHGAVLVVVLAALLAWPVPAHAGNRTVEVAGTEEGAFTPSEVAIEAGDTVTWEWTANESHTVTFGDPDHPERDGACLRLDGDGFRDCEGYRHVVTFEEVGEFPYRDGRTGSEGLVVVTEKATAPPKPTPTEDPTTEPASSETAEPEPQPTSEPEPSPEPSPDPEPEPDPEPPPPPPPPPPPSAGTAAPPPVGQDVDRPTEDAADEPTVAGAASSSPVPEPTFEDFPEAADPTPGEGVDGEVALDLPDDDGDDDSTRTVWGVLGGVTLLGTLGVFGRRVLFAEPWTQA